MNELTNEKCPVCGEPLEQDGKNIVYCPDCGRPVHENCWTGTCPDIELHKNGYEWRQEAPQQTADDEADEPAPDNSVFGTATDINTAYNDPEEFFRKVNAQYSSDDKRLDEETEIGVSPRELFFYCNANNGHFVRFQTMLFMAQTGKKVRFGLMSGLLKPFFQFYRGMYLTGLLILLAQIILSLPTIIYYYGLMYYSAAVESLVNGGGFLAALSLSSYMSLGLTVLLFLFGDYLQLIHSVRQIKSLRRYAVNMPQQDYYALLSEKGRGRPIRMIIALLVQLLAIGVAFLILSRIYPV